MRWRRLERWLVEIEELHGAEIGGAVVDEADPTQTESKGKGKTLIMTMATAMCGRSRCKPQLQPPRPDKHTPIDDR